MAVLRYVCSVDARMKKHVEAACIVEHYLLVANALVDFQLVRILQ